MFHDNKELYEFSDFRLDISERLLLRKGKRVSLSEKAFEMLCVLVRQSGHLVSKDELLAEVWTDTIVEENNLDKNVSLLRQVLGERKGKEKFIETVRGRGYRFVAEVERIKAEENGQSLKNAPASVKSDDKKIIQPAAKYQTERSGKVIALADWRHEPEEDEKLQQAILTPTQIKEFPQAKRKKFPLVGAVIFGLLILALGFFAFTRFRSETPTADAPIKTLAVLPFVNGSNDANLDYLSDGLSESLIDRLAQLSQLKVIARSSSFKYRGQNIDLSEAANALGVRAIVTGRLVRRGDDLIIRVEMIDTRDNRQLWSDNFTRKLSDAQKLQTDISREIAENLRLRLSGAQTRQLTGQETSNPQAYELLLKGLFYWRKGGWENLKKAVEYYEQAIVVDPNYALAYAKLSVAYTLLVGNNFLNSKEFIPKAEAAARKALELDENLAEAHLATAMLNQTAWGWAAAEAAFKRAIELNPNLADVRLRYATYLGVIGRHDEAIIEAKHARELDPLSLRTSLSVADAFLFARRFDEAIEESRKILELDKNYIPAYYTLGYSYAAKGIYGEAIANYQEAMRRGGNSTGLQIYLGAAYARSGEREKALEILKQLETGKESAESGELPVLYVALGEREKAFASFEKAYAAHDSQLQFLKVESNFDSLHDDPRFQDLVRRVGLPQ
ncbi:MAG: winged helix-turn-helix domain-containing protein [Acidobacteria bacterium]|jgi:TolB-like protein/DNA-binding winged helix-turn-helix (wHTH) protein/lipopolysaccharide biosynthesis regulator YciM|nr:winged helix-turn-helix domain-containing protein [Acidobacteriota bacterium]